MPTPNAEPDTLPTVAAATMLFPCLVNPLPSLTKSLWTPLFAITVLVGFLYTFPSASAQRSYMARPAAPHPVTSIRTYLDSGTTSTTVPLAIPLTDFVPHPGSIIMADGTTTMRSTGRGTLGMFPDVLAASMADILVSISKITATDAYAAIFKRNLVEIVTTKNPSNTLLRGTVNSDGMYEFDTDYFLGIARRTIDPTTNGPSQLLPELFTAFPPESPILIAHRKLGHVCYVYIKKSVQLDMVINHGIGPRSLRDIYLLCQCKSCLLAKMRQQSYPRRDCAHPLNNLPPLPPPPSPIIEIPPVTHPLPPPIPSVAPMTNICSDISAPYPRQIQAR